MVDGQPDIVVKLLSVDPTNYDDAPTEGIRRILEKATGQSFPRGQPLDSSNIRKALPSDAKCTNAAVTNESSQPIRNNPNGNYHCHKRLA